MSDDLSFEKCHAESDKLVIGIDATNILQGGGRTHLIELINGLKIGEFGISKVVIWAGISTLALIRDHPSIEKVNTPFHEKGLLLRTFWQRFYLSVAASKIGCDVLFIPGGSYSGSFRPVVVMSQNLLPFEIKELKRFGFSLLASKLLILRYIQARSIKTADGLICLTQYAKGAIERVTPIPANVAVIPHGVNERFRRLPKRQISVEKFSAINPYRILYVSTVFQYKHQWNVVEAVSRLRENTGWNLSLDLIGSAYPSALNKLETAIQRYDPNQSWITYHGAVPFDQLHLLYERGDLGVFASTCENLPNILLEKMACGLPIASSNCGPMPEVLQNSGVYFDAENPRDIECKLREIIESPKLRTNLSNTSHSLSQRFTWEICAHETFSYLVQVCQQFKKNKEYS